MQLKFIVLLAACYAASSVKSYNQSLFGNPPAQPCTCGKAQQPTVPINTQIMPSTNYNNNNNNVELNGGKTNQALSTSLLSKINAAKPASNIIYSPLSMEILLTFVTLGARGRTALELQSALHLPANEQQIIAQAMQKLNRQYDSHDTKVVMLNKMYYAHDLSPARNINRFAHNLQTKLQRADFASPTQAASKINKWVAKNTNQHIKNLISPESLNSQTESILLNAIHFKGKWNAPFSTSDTKKEKFYNMGNRPVLVDIMHIEEEFPYGEFPELGVKIMAMPYRNSNMSMMIILPNTLNGLDQVEKNLASQDLDKLAQRLEPTNVNVGLPKFKFECELDMVQPLMQAGIREMFSSNADLSGFFNNNSPKVSKVQSKAFLDVNEAGSEAAAASFYRLVPLSLPPEYLPFIVDHPFIFAIRAPNVVYFMGHVVSM